MHVISFTRLFRYSRATWEEPGYKATFHFVCRPKVTCMCDDPVPMTVFAQYQRSTQACKSIGTGEDKKPKFPLHGLILERKRKCFQQPVALNNYSTHVVQGCALISKSH